MKLGDAIQKRRAAKRPSPRTGGRPGGASRGGLRGVRFAGWLIGLATVGLGAGFLIGNRVLFPAPPPPQDLVEVPSVRGVPVERARERVLAAGLELAPTEGIRHPALDSGVVLGQAPLAGQLARPGDAVLLTISLGPVREAVPEMVGLHRDRALRLLEGSGLQAEFDTLEAEDPVGTVLAVDPPAGSVVRVPGTVRLTVSVGPPVLPMPDLVGMTEARAVDSLRALGIAAVAVDTVFRFGRDQGLVVAQDPPGDSLVLRSGQVRLSVGREGTP